MANPVFLIMRPDGSLSVAHPCGFREFPHENETVETWLARVRADLATTFPDATIRLSDTSALPADRSQRDKWQVDGERVGVAEPKR